VLRNGIATKPELLAAGYNSNPMRLPHYLKNGGAEWRTLIPAETQMYLRIYSSVDNTLELGSDSGGSGNDSTPSPAMAAVIKPLSAAAVLSWLGQSLSTSGSFLRLLVR